MVVCDWSSDVCSSDLGSLPASRITTRDLAGWLAGRIMCVHHTTRVPVVRLAGGSPQTDLRPGRLPTNFYLEPERKPPRTTTMNVHIYIHMYIHIYVHTYIHTYMHTYICTSMHTCIHNVISATTTTITTTTTTTSTNTSNTTMYLVLLSWFQKGPWSHQAKKWPVLSATHMCMGKPLV